MVEEKGRAEMNCRICDVNTDTMVLDLGLQPWCNNFLRHEHLGTEPLYPLRIFFCTVCRTPQLDFTVPKETMFGDHTYLSGVTRSLDEHFRAVAHDVAASFFPRARGRSVLDIGSNDGTQLRHYRQLGFDVLGIESSATTAAIANDANIPTIHAYFNSASAAGLGRRFDIINASGVFFHLEELHDVTDAVRAILNHGGVFVVQFLYFKNILENTAFDQIYHEHLLYYNVDNFQRLLRLHDLDVFDAFVSSIHGGSVIAYCGHAGTRKHSARLLALLREEEESGCNTLPALRRFASAVERLKQVNIAYLDKCHKLGKTVFGMGAPVKGNTLLNYFGVTRNWIECLVERNQLRRGLYAPGSHIPVRIEDEDLPRPDVYYVLAWNFKQEILTRYRALREDGVEFYFPINPSADSCRV